MDNNIEIWKDIEGYKGLYQVSNLGRVKTLRKVVNNYPNCTRVLPEKIRNGNVNKSLGYKMVSLSKDGKLKNEFVHRLVAKAFIPNPNNYPMVNHKDEDKTNNVVSNLEWCTARYNMAYSDVFGAAKKKNSKPVRQYDFDGNLVKEFSSSKEAGKELGVMPYCIGYCCQGKIGSVKGFLWRYADDKYEKKHHIAAHSRRVVQKDMDGNILNIWKSIKEAAVSTGTNEGLIGRCCHKARNSTNGFKWEFYDKEPIIF